MGADDGPRTIKSAGRLFALVQGLDELEQAGVTQLAEYVDLPTSTVHQYLASLVENEYVVKRGDTYRLALRFLGHGMKIRDEMPLYTHSQPVLEELAEETEEIAWLLVKEHGVAVTLSRVVGEHGLEKFRGRVGGRSELHTHAAGKAILANIPRQRVDEIIEQRGLISHTDQTITDPDVLYEELAEIRERGYAYNEDETIPGIRSVGAAITGADDEVLGAVAVGGPENRLKGEYFCETLPDLLTGAANEIELKVSVESVW